jgi:AraC-like DNA-binding protein
MTARFDLGELTHRTITDSESLRVPGSSWFLVLSGMAHLETADGFTPLATGDAVWVDARTASAVATDAHAELAIGDLRVVVAAHAVPSPLVIREFAARHTGVADLVRTCPLDGACRASLFAEGYGALIGAAMTDSWLDDQGAADTGDLLVKHVVDAVVADPANKWSVESLAALVHLSRSALSARFQKTLGRSPARMVREVRMGEARRLLAEPDITVEAVAARCGYGSLAAFSRAFAADHGTSPQSWRNDVRQDPRSAAKPNPLTTAQAAPSASVAATP